MFFKWLLFLFSVGSTFDMGDVKVEIKDPHDFPEETDFLYLGRESFDELTEEYYERYESNFQDMDGVTGVYQQLLISDCSSDDWPVGNLNRAIVTPSYWLWLTFKNVGSDGINFFRMQLNKVELANQIVLDLGVPGDPFEWRGRDAFAAAENDPDLQELLQGPVAIEFHVPGKKINAIAIGQSGNADEKLISDGHHVGYKRSFCIEENVDYDGEIIKEEMQWEPSHCQHICESYHAALWSFTEESQSCDCRISGTPFGRPGTVSGKIPCDPTFWRPMTFEERDFLQKRKDDEYYEDEDYEDEDHEDEDYEEDG